MQTLLRAREPGAGDRRAQRPASQCPTAWKAETGRRRAGSEEGCGEGDPARTRGCPGAAEASSEGTAPSRWEFESRSGMMRSRGCYGAKALSPTQVTEKSAVLRLSRFRGARRYQRGSAELSGAIN